MHMKLFVGNDTVTANNTDDYDVMTNNTVLTIICRVSYQVFKGLPGTTLCTQQYNLVLAKG